MIFFLFEYNTNIIYQITPTYHNYDIKICQNTSNTTNLTLLYLKSQEISQCLSHASNIQTLVQFMINVTYTYESSYFHSQNTKIISNVPRNAWLASYHKIIIIRLILNHI